MKKTMAILSAAMIAVGAALCAGWGFGPAAAKLAAASSPPALHPKSNPAPRV